MSGIVELGKLPALHSVAISAANAVKSLPLPVDCFGFRIYSPTADTKVYWALESGQVASATGKRRTIPAGSVGEVLHVKALDGGTLYLTASKAATIEVEVYERA